MGGGLAGRGPGQQWPWPVVVAVLVVLATVWPLTWPLGRDSFPLTPYPMFAGHRPDATVQLVVAVGDTPTELVVLPTEATGHRQLTQAARALAQAVRDGGDRPGRLCVEVAEWVASSDRADIDRVRLVTVAYDGIGYLRHDRRTPRLLAEHATCGVER